MKTWSTSLLCTVLLTTIAIKSSEATRTKAKQTQLDLQLYDAVTYQYPCLTASLLSRKANPNADVSAIVPADRYSYRYGRRPLVRALYNLEFHTVHYMQFNIKKHLEIIQSLLEHGANPNVTLCAETNVRAFENHLKFTCSHRTDAAYKALELLLAHGATTDVNSVTPHPHGIHELAKDNPKLKKILKEYAAKVREEIAGATYLSPDTAGVVVKYVAGEPT